MAVTYRRAPRLYLHQSHVPPKKDGVDGLRLSRMRSFGHRKLLPELWQEDSRRTRQMLPVLPFYRQLFFDWFYKVNHLGLQFLRYNPVDR